MGLQVLYSIPIGISSVHNSALYTLLRLHLRALRARTKSSPMASKSFGLQPNGNPPTASKNTGVSRLTTGASRPDKELAYGEQNVRSSAELKPDYDGQ